MSKTRKRQSSGYRLLRGKEIENLLLTGELFVGPLLEGTKYIGPIGMDLRLDAYFLEIRHTGKGIIDPFERFDAIESTELIEVELFGGVGYTLQPGKFVLGQTFEYVSLPKNVFGLLDGRSSLGRLGIVVHSTAMSVDPGWEGHLTLELRNNGEMPVTLAPLTRVARLILFEMASKEVDDRTDYSSLPDTEKKYYRQVKPSPSRIFGDEDLQRLKKINDILRKEKNEMLSRYFGED
jgi:dCTP deaminase